MTDDEKTFWVTVRQTIAMLEQAEGMLWEREQRLTARAYANAYQRNPAWRDEPGCDG